VVMFGACFLVVILVRGGLAPTSMVAYRCIVLAERAAGTPAGDWFASRRGLGLGPPAALLLRRRSANSRSVALSANQEVSLRLSSIPSKNEPEPSRLVPLVAFD